MALAATTQPIIAARNVDKFFGQFQALRDVTASFAEGEVTAIIARQQAAKRRSRRQGAGFVERVGLTDQAAKYPAQLSGITMLFVAHEMGFAREVADRVIFFDESVILEDTTPEAFFGKPQHERARSFLSQVRFG